MVDATDRMLDTAMSCLNRCIDEELESPISAEVFQASTMQIVTRMSQKTTNVELNAIPSMRISDEVIAASDVISHDWLEG